VGIVIGLNEAACQQAWAEGEEMRRRAVVERARRYGDSITDSAAKTWHHVRGRAAELAVEHWLGLPLLPMVSWHEERIQRHFDVAEPWAVQVKSVNSANDNLHVGLPPKRDCWTCPYILVWSQDVSLHTLLGWATGSEVKEHGYGVTWAAGGKSICLPQNRLHSIPGPTVLHVRMFHRGMHSICPAGR
jgi:hypothetical protein